MVRNWDPWRGAILVPGTFVCINLVKDHQAMPHTKVQASEPISSEQEDFLLFFIYFYGSNLGRSGAGPS